MNLKLYPDKCEPEEIVYSMQSTSDTNQQVLFKERHGQ